MENKIRQSIVKTVLYADIFNYPLTSKQLWKYLISKRKVNKKTFDKVLKNLPNPISSKSALIFIKGKHNLIDKKVEMIKESGKKLSVAYRAISFLSIIPWVKLIGISGGLSMENSKKQDDIDIFVITSKNRIWLTRMFLVIMLKFLGNYRSRVDKKFENKICLNMLIDENHLSFEKEENIYIAHEIAQLVPIFDRGGIYYKFIKNNLWVKKYLPNAFPEIPKSNLKKKNSARFIDYIEVVVMNIQLWYIRKHKTIEVIENGFLSFHPFDYGAFVLEEYSKRVKIYGKKN